ncbi:MAG: CopG family transcriptional regulator [Terriglobia bacterium]|jgi:predicted transcriptional regulator
MEKQTVTFPLDSDKVAALDTLAEALDRDRDSLLSEAVTAYLDVQQWQVEQIRAGLRQAEAGELIDHDEVREMAAKWRQK